MESDEPQRPDTLEVIESALAAALREVRRARARAAAPEVLARVSGQRSTSNAKRCFDVLEEAGRPLHITELVAALRKSGVTTTRDSLVSALTKQLAPKGPFIRTAPNTFDLSRPGSREE